MIDKEIGPQEAAGREAELNEGDKSLPDLPLETKRKFNGHGKGSWNEEAPGRPRWTSDTTPVDEYEYRRADGSHAFFIGKGVRPDGEKVFSTRRANCISFGARLEPEDKVAYFPGLGNEPKVLFRLPELVAAAPGTLVLITEGEKDAMTAVSLGFNATCNPFGAGKWEEGYSRVLAGRDVVICGDSDDVGRRHVALVARSVAPYAKRTRILTLQGLAEHGDLTDWAAARNGKDEARNELLALIKAAPEAAAQKSRADMVCVADVQPRAIDWLWPGRIARGKLTVFGGHPGVSKSTVTIDIAARITTGNKWPCGEGNAPKGRVIMLTVEDEIGDTIRPRLDAAGADVERVHVLRGIVGSDNAGRRSFDLSIDIEHLEGVVHELGDVMLIIIDPVTAYMGKPGKVDSYRVTDVRSLLMPLQEMASRLNVAVIAVNHLTKTGSAEALMRFLGSVGMVAAGRAAYLIAKDPAQPDRRLLLPAKNNLGDDRTGCAFRIHEKSTGYDQPAYAIAVDWEAEHVSITADEVLSKSSDADGRRSPPAEKAKDIIREMLKEGPRPQAEVASRMADEGISRKSWRAAKEALRVISTKKPDKSWEWSLPPKKDEPF